MTLLVLLLLLRAFLLSSCTNAISSAAFLHNHQRDLSTTATARIQSQSSLSATPPKLTNEDLPNLNVAILGGGNVGTILAQKLKESDKFGSVTIAARNPEKTRIDVQARGGSDIDVAEMSEVLRASQIVILATTGLYDDDDIQQFCDSLGDMAGIIIIDATNPLGSYSDGLQARTWDGGVSSGEKLQKYLPAARVYKSFNTVGLEHMKEALGKDMLIAGDPDPSCRSIAEEVVKGVGFRPFYVGPIRYARNLEAMAELWIHMAIPGLGGRDTSRNFWFSVSGDP